MTPLTLPLVLAALFATAVAIYGWPRRSAPGAAFLTPVLLSAALWAGAAALSALAPGAGHLWSRLAWLGIAPLPALWLLFCLDFTGARKAVRPARVVAVIGSPVLVGVALWGAATLGGGGSAIALDAGLVVPALAQLYGWLLAALGLALLARRFVRSTSIYRRQCAVLLVTGALPVAVRALHALGLDALGGADPTPASFSVASVVLGWGLFAYRLFDMTPIAHETVFNAIGDGVVITDVRGRITTANPVALAELGRTLHEVVGKPLHEVHRRWPEATTDTAGTDRVELPMLIDGRERDVEVRAFPVYDDERRLYGRVYISQDVTDRNAHQRRIEEMAYRDFLTGLPNRRALHESMERAIAFARRRQLSIALLVLDLDRFKDINDALGHPAGDLVLQHVASRLLATTRKEDTLARLGGDELAVLLYDCDAAGAQIAAERMLHALREPVLEVRRTRLHLDASVGIAIHAGGTTTVDELLAQADIALYRAKEGTDRIELYRPTAPAASDDQARPEDEFREALRTEQLGFKYQPVVDLATGAVMAAEALVRWEHPTRGLTHPSHFLGMVEERDLALDLDRYVLDHALAEVAAGGIDVCVNLSARSVLDRQIVDAVGAALQRTGLPPRRLVLEITERALAVPELTRPVLYELRKLGVRIAADDFGTGYSALAYLRHFPLSMLKLDRFLVAGIGRRVEDEAIIRAVIMIARTMGLAVVGEGVETPEQLHWLEAQGCQGAQGFLLARPQRWDDFRAWAESQPGRGRGLKLAG